MITILYAAIAGIAITLVAEVSPRVHAGNWDKEMKEYACNSVRMRPRIGAAEVACVKVTVVVKVP